MEYKEHTKQILRQRLGLNKDDTSHDHHINTLSPEDAARALIAWELGDARWYDFFMSTLRQVTGKSDETLNKDIFGR